MKRSGKLNGQRSMMTPLGETIQIMKKKKMLKNSFLIFYFITINLFRKILFNETFEKGHALTL